MRQYTLLYILVLFLITNLSYSQKQKKDKSQPLDEISISGLKWRSVGPALTSGRISDIAVNPDNQFEYYVAVSSGGVWKTTNAGLEYTPVFDGEGSYSIGCVTIDPNNSSVIWVGSGENNNQRSVAYGDGVYKSNDAGKSWKNMGLKNSEHIGKIIVHPNNSDVVYVAAIGPLWNKGGDRGLYMTKDGGKTWTQQTSPVDYPLLGVCFVNSKRGWIVGYQGVILMTEDSGKTWERQQSQADIPLMDVCFVSENEGWVVGGNGTILHTLDAGEHWEHQEGQPVSFLWRVLFKNRKKGWTVGSEGAILYTENGGQTWTRQQSRTDQWLYDITLADQKTLYAVGLYGVVLKNSL